MFQIAATVKSDKGPSQAIRKAVIAAREAGRGAHGIHLYIPGVEQIEGGPWVAQVTVAVEPKIEDRIRMGHKRDALAEESRLEDKEEEKEKEKRRKKRLEAEHEAEETMRKMLEEKFAAGLTATTGFAHTMEDVIEFEILEFGENYFLTYTGPDVRGYYEPVAEEFGLSEPHELDEELLAEAERHMPDFDLYRAAHPSEDTVTVAKAKPELGLFFERIHTLGSKPKPEAA